MIGDGPSLIGWCMSAWLLSIVTIDRLCQQLLAAFGNKIAFFWCLCGLIGGEWRFQLGKWEPTLYIQAYQNNARVTTHIKLHDDQPRCLTHTPAAHLSLAPDLHSHMLCYPVPLYISLTPYTRYKSTLLNSCTCVLDPISGLLYLYLRTADGAEVTLHIANVLYSIIYNRLWETMHPCQSRGAILSMRQVMQRCCPLWQILGYWVVTAILVQTWGSVTPHSRRSLVRIYCSS